MASGYIARSWADCQAGRCGDRGEAGFDLEKRQEFSDGSFVEACIESDKRHWLTETALQVQAARELNRIARTESVAAKNIYRHRGDLRV